MQARSADTDSEAERVQLDLLRSAGPGRRVQMALSLSADVIGLSRRAIARALPNATQEEVLLRSVDLFYGDELGAEVRRYIASRAR